MGIGDEMNTGAIGEQFDYGKSRYQICGVQWFDGSCAATIDALNANGKDGAFYFANKILKSGKPSAKQGGTFYRFTKSGNFVKL